MATRANLAQRARRLALRALGIFVAASVLAVLALRFVDPWTSAFMLRAQLAALGSGPSVRYTWVEYRAISPYAAIAVVASEDQKFPRHSGFDFDAIQDALEDSADGGPMRGASTITQQVAKNLFLWPGKSFARKGLEAYFTVLIEAFWPKRRILEVYLNVAEFGPGVFGVGEASRRFFGTSAARLDREQAARLAAVLPSPRRMRADRPSEYVRRRTGRIQQEVSRLGGPAYLRAL